MMPATTRRELDSGWTFRQLGQETWLPARVPGSNFTDLWRAGLIEDPYFGDAEPRLEWIERADWEYRCTFDVTPEELAGDGAALVFDGLDTLCDVRLNGAPLLSAANMFRTYRVEVKDRLRIGTNELALHFRSPVAYGEACRAADGFCYPAENDKTDARASAHVRKAPYHFGWDWGPKYITAGVWRPVWLDVVRRGRIVDLHYRIESLSDAQAVVTFDVEVEGNGRVDIVCDAAGVAPVRVAAGERTARVVIDDPRRWWPNGLGEAFLYRFTATLSDDAGAIDRATTRIGLRTIRVRNEPDAIGECFAIEVNGRPTFMKGANYIPSDSFLERVTPERYRQLFRDAVDANMNMLRVWGGGTYERDLFYDLADEHGILIWQDFMFSCTLYPSDPAFLANVAEEARQQIRRLRRHPSLALWCGNNEVSLGIAHWNWPTTFAYPPDLFDRLVAGNRDLFERLLPDLVAAHDSDRFYMPSSPIGFWNDPGDDRRGDSHYWGVWHGEEPLGTYAERVPRFMSEYGFQSYPDIASIERFTDPDDRVVGSAVLSLHQKHPRGDAIIGQFLRKHFGEPRTFAAFCTLSQLTQADALRIAFEAHRRAMPRCMGSLYWQFNDCFPAISWSSIDYYGRWKALHYQAARSFAPLILSAEPVDGGFAIHAVSDLFDPVAGELVVELIDFDGRVLWSLSQPVEIAPNAADIVAHAPAHGSVLVSRIVCAEGEVARDVRMVRDATACRLPDPGLSLRVECDAVVVRTERFARAVRVGVDGGNPTDNFFDLLPGEERRLTLRDGQMPDAAQVTVESLYDWIMVA
ncbi:glycoside hydrolase [Nostoc sp. 3335mG]|nr:glycoside hydrolase [Nostoc sp. 3335mG]